MSISQRVLQSLQVGNEFLIQIQGLRYLPYKMMWGYNLQGFNRASVQTALSRSVKKGLVEKRVEKGQVYLRLTELGEEFLARREGKATLSLSVGKTKWDGLYRFVFFDIPESERIIRDTLRKALKAAGAVAWQKSVWVTKENITRQLNEFVEDNGLLDYCSVLEVREVYNPKLRKLLEEV